MVHDTAPGSAALAPELSPPDGLRPGRLRGLRNRLIGAPWFQAMAARVPGLSRIARTEGEAIFDVVSGFVYSQVLLALVRLDLLAQLRDRAARPEALALRHGIAPQRMRALLQAAAALRLMERRRDGAFQTSARGAALLAVPGLGAMIDHHDLLYRDLTDPVAFLRGQTETELAGFWPYVFGARGDVAPEVTARYSALMEQSQALVAEETLRTVSLRGVRRLMDVGGGTGAFLRAVAAQYPAMHLTLLDLPGVIEAARARFAAHGMPPGSGLALRAGSFRDDGPLPDGADTISLVRVLYDHADDTVLALLQKVRAALPPGGGLVVSEPMSGGARPQPATDGYFAFYCMAMRTGRVRSQAEIAEMLARVGFVDIRTPSTGRPFVTSVVTARRP